MPAALTFPGVYIEELSSGVRTITGVATSITAFIGASLRGPVDTPTRVQSFAEFERTFGGLSRQSPMTYAVNQFFQNGGADALIVRVAGAGAQTATGAADNPATMNLVAASAGDWGEKLRVRVDHTTRPEVGVEQLFNLTVADTSPGGPTERFLNVSVLPAHPRFVGKVLEEESKLIRLSGAAPAAKPAVSAPVANDPLPPGSLAFNTDGADGATITDAEVSAAALQAPKRGIWALEKADLFNLLCVPPFSFEGDVGSQTRSEAATYAKSRRALYIVDPLVAWDEPSDLTTGANSLDNAAWGLARTENAALYFPRLRVPDALQEGRLARLRALRRRRRDFRPHRQRRAACGRRPPASTRRSTAWPSSP